MDLELKNLGQTLAVGGLTIYCSFHLLCAVWRGIPNGFLQAPGSKLNIQHSAVYLAVILAVGILAEDVAKSFAANRYSSLYEPLSLVLDRDKSIRFKNLFEITTTLEGKKRLEGKPLLKELINSTILTDTTNTDVLTLRKQFTEGNQFTYVAETDQEFKKIADNVNILYYQAKNHVYAKETYFSELVSQEHRINFTRSLAVVFIVLCLLSLCGVLLWLLRGKLGLPAEFPKDWKHFLKLAAIYACATSMATKAYEDEATHFNLRCFGYYIAIANPIPKIAQSEPGKPHP